MGMQEIARAARMRIESATYHLERARIAISGPGCDWTACDAHIEMAGDVLAGVQRPEEVRGMTVTDDGGIVFGTVGYKGLGATAVEGGEDGPA